MSLVVGGDVVFVINLEMEMLNFEINDIIEVGDWIYNVGVFVSCDIWYG